MKSLLIVFLFMSSLLYAKLEYSIQEFADYTKGYPSFTFTPSKTVNKLEVIIKKDGKVFIKKNYKNIFEKTKKTITLKQKEGEVNYTISIKGTHIDDETIEDSFEMKGVRVKPIQLFFKASDVDVENRNVKFDASREITKVEVTIYNTQKKEIYKKETEINPATKKGVEITWDKLNDEILTININAFDKWNYWSGMNINPFSVDIPHKEIEFASGKWDVDKKELPKLKESYKKVSDAINKYGQALKLKLYIAGYTDTVGDKNSNLQLSEKRAKSIALAFKKLGLNIPIYYQGFGESVLRKSTKDEVDEVMNRRAIYVLSSQSPAISKTIPSDKWKTVK
jgi:outer membrane protein OmpA-like peptidoglycan-associated protein